jgi:hypothetical protein
MIAIETDQGQICEALKCDKSTDTHDITQTRTYIHSIDYEEWTFLQHDSFAPLIKHDGVSTV